MGRLSSGEPPREARKTKTREFSVNWMYYDDKKLEIVDGTKGCPLDSSDEQVIISRVAPHSLYQQFKKVCFYFIYCLLIQSFLKMSVKFSLCYLLNMCYKLFIEKFVTKFKLIHYSKLILVLLIPV